MPKLSQNQLLLFGAGFGFVTGYTNLICIARYSAFGTMMTGNILMMAKNFVETGMERKHGELPLPVFFALIIASRHLGMFLYHLAAQAKMQKIFIPAVFLVVLASETQKYLMDKDFIPERWNVWFVAFCFGVQSSVTFPAMGKPTMLVTGHLSDINYKLIEVVCGQKSWDHLKQCAYGVINTSGVLIGAGLGAFANIHSKGSIASAFLLTPITLLQVCLLERAFSLTVEPDPPAEKKSS